MTETLFPIQQSRKLYEMMVIRSAIGLLENHTSELNKDGDEGTETYNNLRDPKFDIVQDGTSFNLLWKRAKQFEPPPMATMEDASVVPECEPKRP